MRAVLQRVLQATVRVEGEVVGVIGTGLLILLGVAQGDNEKDADWLGKRAAELRIFSDGEGRFNRSLLDIGGEALVVSQFTLLADTRRGRRPSFIEAAPPEVAAPLCERVVQTLAGLGVPVQRGRFGALMDVELVNHGPVTLILNSRDRR